MNAVNIESLFEDSMQRISAGADLERVLADFPNQADELRPMLEAAVHLQKFSAELAPSQSAQMRSRSQFLTAAAGMASTSTRRGFQFSLFHLRLAASSAILIGILAAVLLLGTGFASADALPGDVFYPVKIMVEQMQINMVQDPPARLQMVAGYDDRRQEEVARLTQMQRHEPVTFNGYLKNAGNGQWQIGSVQLKFPAGGPDPTSFENAYVEIMGTSDSQVVEVQSIKLRQLEWEGVLQKFDEQTWVISGLSILLTDNTEVSGQPQIGASVHVIAVKPSGDQFTALSLTVISLPSTVVQFSPQPSQTTSSETGGSKETGENAQPTSEPNEISPSPRSEIQPTRTMAIEENNGDPSQTPVPAPTRKNDEERHGTRTPNSDSRTSKTPEGDSHPTNIPGHDD